MTSPPADPSSLPPGRLAENVAHFVHALRRAGVKVGSSQLHTALEAVEAAGFTRRGDFYWVLRSTLITRPEQFDTFHQVFRMFWRTPDYIEKMMEIMLPVLQTLAPDRGPPKAAERRAREAMADDSAGTPPPGGEQRQQLELDASLSWSQAEVIRDKDFEQMSADELAAAAAAIRRLVLPVAPLRTRRLKPHAHGHRPDMRAMLRRSMRRGGEFDRLELRRQGTRRRILWCCATCPARCRHTRG